MIEKLILRIVNQMETESILEPEEKDEYIYAYTTFCEEILTLGTVCIVTQEYTENGAIRSYTTRCGYITYSYAAAYTIPQVTYSSDPKYVDSNGNTVRTFSPWTNQQVLISVGTKVRYSKKNTTTVGYSSNNGYYLTQGYMVGNSDYMVVPWYGNSVKAKLGNS
ncbi:MAG: hypothetical protein MR508_05085 [Lachnospiraceae bacterium]|nr:hypothetical protein [Lachnospiraceae bacterium]